MKEFNVGLKHFFAATSFLAKHHLLHYYLLPLLLSIVFYIGVSAVIISVSKSIALQLFGMSVDDSKQNTDGLWSFLKQGSGDFLHYVATFILGLFIFLLVAKFSKYLILILLSPVFARLSEVTEEKLTGIKYPFSLNQFIKDIFRGITIALRNLFIEFLLIAIFGLLGGPLVVFILPFLWLIGAYFYGFSMIDYTSERRKLSISKSVTFVRKHKILAITNGGLYALLDLIPIIGLTIAPINAVVGATTAIIEIEQTIYGKDN